MTRILTIATLALWCAAVALSGAFFGPSLLGRGGKSAESAGHGKAKTVTTKTTGVVNIPVMKDGEILGYLIVKMKYVLEGEKDDPNAADAPLYLTDEAIRVLVADSSKFSLELHRYDLKKAVARIHASVKARMGNDSMKKVFFSEFNFVKASDIR